MHLLGFPELPWAVLKAAPPCCSICSENQRLVNRQLLHGHERRISADKKRHGGERFVLPPLPQGSGGYLIKVTDLLLHLFLNRPPPGFTCRPSGSGRWGRRWGCVFVQSISGSAPPWEYTLSSMSESSFVCVWALQVGWIHHCCCYWC